MLTASVRETLCTSGTDRLKSSLTNLKWDLHNLVASFTYSKETAVDMTFQIIGQILQAFGEGLETSFGWNGVFMK